MDRNVTLRRATIDDKEAVKHLWDLYSYDFSVYDGDDVDEQARYNFYYGDEYFDSDNRMIFLVEVNGKHAGFVSVSNTCYILNKPDDKSIVDFFIMNKYRRGGIGRIVAGLVFDMFPGRWEVVQWENNESSKIFWEKVISAYTGNHYEIRHIFTREMTLQAIIFDTINHIGEPQVDCINKLLNYTIKLYRHPDETIINQIALIAESNVGEDDDSIKAIRKDLEYQQLLALEDEDNNIVSFLIFTSLRGIITETNIGTDSDYRHQGYASALMLEFKQRMKLAGFDYVYAEVKDPERFELCYSTAAFLEENGFRKLYIDGDYQIYKFNLS